MSQSMPFSKVHLQERDNIYIPVRPVTDPVTGRISENRTMSCALSHQFRCNLFPGLQRDLKVRKELRHRLNLTAFQNRKDRVVLCDLQHGKGLERVFAVTLILTRIFTVSEILRSFNT